MENHHSLLKRQLKHNIQNLDSLSEDFRTFINTVNDSYNEFDADRTMLERSLELSSQELLQANADMRAVFNTSPDLFIWIDKEGVITDSKGGKESDLYLPSDKLIGKKIQNIPIKSLGIKFQKAVKRVFKTKSIISIDYSFKKNNNENFYEARLLPLTDNQIITIIRNTTEAKKAEKNLRESEERIRLIIENALDAVIMIDDKGIITDWNSRAEKIFGWAKEEMLGQPMSDMIIPHQHREAHKKGLKHFLKTGKGNILDKQIEITALRKNGNEFPVELSISPIRMSDKFVFSAFVSDITDRKQAEDELNKRNKDLEILHTITEMVHKSLDLEEVYKIALDMTMEMESVDIAFIYLTDNKRENAVLQAYRNLPDDYLRRAKYLIPKVLHGKPLIQENY